MLTIEEAQIVALLAEGERNILQIKKQLPYDSENALVLARISKLEQSRLILGSGLPKTYRLSMSGREELAAFKMRAREILRYI